MTRRPNQSIKSNENKKKYSEIGIFWDYSSIPLPEDFLGLDSMASDNVSVTTAIDKIRKIIKNISNQKGCNVLKKRVYVNAPDLSIDRRIKQQQTNKQNTHVTISPHIRMDLSLDYDIVETQLDHFLVERFVTDIMDFAMSSSILSSSPSRMNQNQVTNERCVIVIADTKKYPYLINRLHDKEYNILILHNLWRMVPLSNIHYKFDEEFNIHEKTKTKEKDKKMDESFENNDTSQIFTTTNDPLQNKNSKRKHTSTIDIPKPKRQKKCNGTKDITTPIKSKSNVGNEKQNKVTSTTSSKQKNKATSMNSKTTEKPNKPKKTNKKPKDNSKTNKSKPLQTPKKSKAKKNSVKKNKSITSIKKSNETNKQNKKSTKKENKMKGVLYEEKKTKENKKTVPTKIQKLEKRMDGKTSNNNDIPGMTNINPSSSVKGKRLSDVVSSTSPIKTVIVKEEQEEEL